MMLQYCSYKMLVSGKTSFIFANTEKLRELSISFERKHGVLTKDSKKYKETMQTKEKKKQEFRQLGVNF